MAGVAAGSKVGELPDEKTRFHSNLLGLMDSLIQINNYLTGRGHAIVNGMLLSGARAVVEKYDKAKLMEMIRSRSLPYWDNILKKEEKKFISEADRIFFDAKPGEVKVFVTLFEGRDSEGKPLVSEINRNRLWDLIHAMVKICIKSDLKQKVAGAEDHARKWNIRNL